MKEIKWAYIKYDNSYVKNFIILVMPSGSDVYSP